MKKIEIAYDTMKFSWFKGCPLMLQCNRSCLRFITRSLQHGGHIYGICKIYINYETGRAEPSIANLCKLADFFGISIDELVGHIQPGTTDSEEADRLAILSSLARQLGREDQEKLCEIAKAFVALQKNCTDK